jgi:hypothetical protein
MSLDSPQTKLDGFLLSVKSQETNITAVVLTNIINRPFSRADFLEEFIMAEIKTEKTLAELKAEAAVILSVYNRILNDPQDGDNFAETDQNLAKALEAYNKRSKEITFTTLKASANPMLAAVKQLTFGVLGKKPQKGNFGRVTYVLNDEKTEQIRLSEFDDFCGGAAADSSWVLKLKEFCLLAAYKNCLDLSEKGSTVKKRLEQTYSIQSCIKTILANVDGGSPISNTQLVKRLQALADAILGSDVTKVDSRDRVYVEKLMNKRGGCGVVVSPSDKTLEVLIMDVLHLNVENKGIVVTYSMKKGATPPSADSTATDDEKSDDTDGTTDEA